MIITDTDTLRLLGDFVGDNKDIAPVRLLIHNGIVSDYTDELLPSGGQLVEYVRNEFSAKAIVVESNPAPTTYTAEQWVSRFLTTLQVVGLQRLEMALITSGQALGPAMSAMKGWLEGILLAASVNPTPRNDWPAPPVTYEAASQEAALLLRPQ